MHVLHFLFDFAVICAFSNSYLIFEKSGLPMPVCIVITVLLLGLFIAINLLPGFYKIRSLRCRILAGGCDLLTAFLLVVSIDALVFALLVTYEDFVLWQFIVYAVVAVLSCVAVFVNGIIRVYTTSAQLGIKLRVLGAMFGMVPVVNIAFLIIIIKSARREVFYEIKHDEIEKSREGQNICATKYPILLVHGVFFRDSKVLNYWGRIPSALKRNGAVLYYGQQQSALPVKDSAAELAERIKQIVDETGCGKVNIIAHSKGGLDCRYAASQLGCAKYIATLTTINTPHKGCLFVDYLFEKIPEKARLKMASVYNTASRTAGDKNPDFLAAVADLGESACAKFNALVPDCEGVLCRSVGSVAKKASSGRFPMDVCYPFVKHTEGENDGLVAVESMKWGSDFRFIEVKGNRGVTHADVIDLNKDNIDGFDVREFYVQIVAELKNMGY